ncbi:Arc family DNA-binding protein [Thioclava sp.]|uniref:Arc family DNA-binding protein n=1 Tax=Thioclava sp. TaxID=1933450 RepID=UPI003AA938F9
MTKTPVAEQVQVNFRMPAELRDRIKLAAERNSRSMNAEIVSVLEEAFPKPKTGRDFIEKLKEVVERNGGGESGHLEEIERLIREQEALERD